MTEFLTRRQLREAERKGQVVTQAPSSREGIIDVADSQIGSAVSDPAVAPEELVSNSEAAEVQVFVSRKERRASESGRAVSPAAAGPLIPERMEPVQVVQDALSEELSDVQIPEVEIPNVEFRETNLFSEPSTQSIILDVAPEAISLPIETGEITITGSIAVLTDTASNVITGSLDGMTLDNADRQDAVTGVISIVEPISALELIHSRVDVGVVPKGVLRKGWWRKWALAVIALGMVIAAFIATITIINLV